MTKFANIKVPARRVLVSALGAVLLFGGMTAAPTSGASAAPRVPVPECGGLNIQAPNFQFDLSGCDGHDWNQFHGGPPCCIAPPVQYRREWVTNPAGVPILVEAKPAPGMVPTWNNWDMSWGGWKWPPPPVPMPPPFY